MAMPFFINPSISSWTSVLFPFFGSLSKTAKNISVYVYVWMYVFIYLGFI